MTVQKNLCPVAGKCGGCQIVNMDYPRQLSFKQAHVIRLLCKFCHVEEIIGMDNPYHYRNKVHASIIMQKSFFINQNPLIFCFIYSIISVIDIGYAMDAM